MSDLWPILRQLMVGLAPQLAAFSVGGSLVYPTILLHQLKSNDTTIHLDIDSASWIGSISGLAGIPAILMPIVMQWKGRKTGFILTCSAIMIGWIICYLSTSTNTILLGESFHGVGTNSLITVSCLSMTEMLAPQYRFFAMLVYGISQGLGMAAAGIGGRFLHYKTICIINFISILVGVSISLMWPESPHWLAYRGEFKKCERVFLWLRGNDDSSQKELTELITAQRENIKLNVSQQKQALFKKFTSRDFYMPCLHIFLLLNMLYWSGGDVVMIYFIDLVEKSTQSENAAFYAGIVLYIIILSGCFITNILARYFKNKTVLISSTIGVIICLIGISIASYLQSVSIVAKDSHLVMYLMIAYTVCNSFGLNAFVFFISAELMPVKHRNIGGAFFIICNCTLYASTLKLSPYMIKHMGMYGTFSIFTLNAIIFCVLVCLYVPETKGRTLQELEDFYTYGKFIQRKIDFDCPEDSNAITL